MAIKHKTNTKTTGQFGYATEWNDDHKIDSDIDFASHSGINVGEPINASDIATKNYVDTKPAGGESQSYPFACTGSGGIGWYLEAIITGPPQGTSNVITKIYMPRAGKIKYLSATGSGTLIVLLNGSATSLTCSAGQAAYSVGISFNAGAYIEVKTTSTWSAPAAVVGVVFS